MNRSIRNKLVQILTLIMFIFLIINYNTIKDSLKEINIFQNKNIKKINYKKEYNKRGFTLNGNYIPSYQTINFIHDVFERLRIDKRGKNKDILSYSIFIKNFTFFKMLIKDNKHKEFDSTKIKKEFQRKYLTEGMKILKTEIIKTEQSQIVYIIGYNPSYKTKDKKILYSLNLELILFQDKIKIIADSEDSDFLINIPERISNIILKKYDKIY